MNEIQEKLLDIYKEFYKVCSKLDIKFCAAGGTLLGAVRHKGFIPWDDDMDFYMTRDEYERFKKEGAHLFKEPYFLQCYETDPEWLRPYVKIRNSNTTAIEKGHDKDKYNQGLWIDIFPVDQYELNIKKLKKFERKRKILIRRVSIKYHLKSKLLGKLRNALIILRYPSSKKAYLKLEKLAKKNYGKDLPYSSMIWTDFTKRKEFFRTECYKNIITCDFEDVEVPVFEDYDETLTIQYGNWRELPPVEKRGNSSGHTISVIKLNQSYKDYLDLNNK